MKNVCLIESSYIVAEGLKRIISSLEGYGYLDNFGSMLEFKVSSMPRNCDIILCNADLFNKDVTLYLKTEIPLLKLLVIDHKDNINRYFASPSNIDGYVFLSCGSEDILKAIVSITAGEKYFCDKTHTRKKHESNEESFLLSNREMEILRFIGAGKTSLQISDALFLSYHTITTHRKNICKKLKVKTVAELVAYAINNNIK